MTEMNSLLCSVMINQALSRSAMLDLPMNRVKGNCTT